MSVSYWILVSLNKNQCLARLKARTCWRLNLLSESISEEQSSKSRQTGVDKLWYQKSRAETVTVAEFEMASNLGSLTRIGMAHSTCASFWKLQISPSLSRSTDYKTLTFITIMCMASPAHASLWNQQSHHCGALKLVSNWHGQISPYLLVRE